MDATLVGPASSDPYGRRALRTSMGTALDHPWAPDPDPIATCRANGIVTLALTPDAGAQRLEDALAQHSGDRVALVLGAEGPGLTDATMAAADACVTIPMAPGIDSLNVAAAAAIACYLVASR
jgi:tRNA G18 (ribose-2'-O)-methylase SpoU